MINFLQATLNTQLGIRLQKEGRLLRLPEGVSEARMNFVPSRPEAEIIAEYLEAWDHLYDPMRFYERVHRYILAMRPTRRALGIKQKEFPAETPPVQLVASKYRRNTSAVLRRILWRHAILAPYRLRFCKLVLDAYKRNPSRIRRFFILCATAENIFPLMEIIHKKARLSNGPGQTHL